MPKPARVGIALLAAAGLAWASLSHALVTVTHARNPNFALKIGPKDPVALIAGAQAKLAEKPDRANARAAVAAARESIRRSPLNSAAFQLLGFAAQGFEDPRKVSERVGFSANLSRRSLRTHLWLIEDAVSRNDVAGALNQYDIALRGNPSSQTLLYPVLTRALNDAAIRKRFLPYMASPPPWLESFLRTAIGTTSNPKAIANLVIAAGGFPEGPEYDGFDAQVIRRLADAGDYRSAVDFYLKMNENGAAILDSAQMTASSTETAYSPITWQPYTIEGIDANFVAGSGDEVQLTAELDSTFTGPIARKILTLAPGTYALSVKHEATRPGPFSRATWRVACASSARPRIIFERSELLREQTTIGGSFAIDPGCPVQMLTMDGTSGVETGSLSLLVGPVSLTRSGRR